MTVPQQRLFRSAALGVLILANSTCGFAQGDVAAGEPVSAEVEHSELLQRIQERIRKITGRSARFELDRNFIQQQRAIAADLRRLLETHGASLSAKTVNDLPGSQATPEPGSASADGTDGGESPPGRTDASQASPGSGPPEVEPDRSLTTPERRRVLADAVWGHLPPREREELMRTFSERFLPKYEEQVRRYFEALSRRDNPSEPTPD